MSEGEIPAGPDWEVGPEFQGAVMYNGGSAEYHYILKRRNKQKRRGI